MGAWEEPIYLLQLVLRSSNHKWIGLLFIKTHFWRFFKKEFIKNGEGEVKDEIKKYKVCLKI